MISRDFKISNKLGLHARPSAQITQVASRYFAEVWISKSERRVNAKSIMGVMMLAAGQGTEIEMEVEGIDETQAAGLIAALVNDKFGEGQ